MESNYIINKDFKLSPPQLEKRMYFLVLGSLSPIQQAIQAGHAALEYAYQYKDDPDYIDFIENWKTWIILNGGTTNNNVDENFEPKGSLNRILKDLILNDVKHSFFYEPDLNDALTAICLVVDERVFNREKYADFDEWIRTNEPEANYYSWSVEKSLDEYVKDTGITPQLSFLKQLLNTKKLA